MGRIRIPPNDYRVELAVVAIDIIHEVHDVLWVDMHRVVEQHQRQLLFQVDARRPLGVYPSWRPPSASPPGRRRGSRRTCSRSFEYGQPHARLFDGVFLIGKVADETLGTDGLLLSELLVAQAHLHQRLRGELCGFRLSDDEGSR
jgi:hypothetical protein